MNWSKETQNKINKLFEKLNIKTKKISMNNGEFITIRDISECEGEVSIIVVSDKVVIK